MGGQRPDRVPPVRPALVALRRDDERPRLAQPAVEGVDENTEMSAPPADASVAETAEEQGIVDQDAAATEALDEADVADDAADDSTEEK